MKVDAADPKNTALASQILLQHNNPLRQQQVQPKKETPPDGIGRTAEKVADKVTVQLELPRNTLDTLQKIGSLGDLLISTAKNVRQTNEALNFGAELIVKMKERLETIVKQYPPFPRESKERMELLMSYSGIQKEITSLMVPPPPPPVYEKVQHLWENLFSGQARSIQTPHLPGDVPDSHVKAAAQHLGNLENQIGLVQEAMGNSIKGI